MGFNQGFKRKREDEKGVGDIKENPKKVMTKKMWFEGSNLRLHK